MKIIWIHTCRPSLKPEDPLYLSVMSVNMKVQSLTHADYPPAVNKPKLISKGPTWVQIGWEPLDCDGGHNVNRYTVQYAEPTLYEYDYDYDYDYLFPYYVYNYRSAAIGVSGYTYTIHNLNPSTEYRFRVLSISSVTSATTRSYFYLTVTTHRTGNIQILCGPIAID